MPSHAHQRQDFQIGTLRDQQLAHQIRANFDSSTAAHFAIGYFVRSGCTAIANKPEIRSRQTPQKLNNKGISVAIKRF
jgi:hypothetical protein